MPKYQVDIPHELAVGEAKQRIAAATEKLERDYGAVVHLEARHGADRLAQGPGRAVVTVEPARVHIDLEPRVPGRRRSPRRSSPASAKQLSGNFSARPATADSEAVQFVAILQPPGLGQRAGDLESVAFAAPVTIRQRCPAVRTPRSGRRVLPGPAGSRGRDRRHRFPEPPTRRRPASCTDRRRWPGRTPTGSTGGPDPRRSPAPRRRSRAGRWPRGWAPARVTPSWRATYPGLGRHRAHQDAPATRPAAVPRNWVFDADASRPGRRPGADHHIRRQRAVRKGPGHLGVGAPATCPQNRATPAARRTRSPGRGRVPPARWRRRVRRVRGPRGAAAACPWPAGAPASAAPPTGPRAPGAAPTGPAVRRPPARGRRPPRDGSPPRRSPPPAASAVRRRLPAVAEFGGEDNHRRA